MSQCIRKLREETGLGIMECKKALDECKGDYDQAKVLATKRSAGRVKPGRETKNGWVSSYVHQGRIGALVQLNCETDFVSRSEEFRTLTDEVAKQVAATSPDTTETLLKSPYIRDTSKTISDMIETYKAKCGENVEVGAFSRYEVGSKFTAV